MILNWGRILTVSGVIYVDDANAGDLRFVHKVKCPPRLTPTFRMEMGIVFSVIATISRCFPYVRWTHGRGLIQSNVRFGCRCKYILSVVGPNHAMSQK